MEFHVGAISPANRSILPPIHVGVEPKSGQVGVWAFLTAEQAREMALKLMAKAVEVEA